MTDAFNKEQLSVEEYFRLEEESLERHEYLQGARREMSGSTIAHSQLVVSTLTAVHFFLRESKYNLFHLEIKLAIEEEKFIAYPDLMIVKGRPQRWNGRDNTIANAEVIIEICTAKTQAFDRGEKFILYRRLPSLKKYILISSTGFSVERYLKKAEGFWVFNEITNPGDLFQIETIGFVCPLKELYERVEF